MNPAIEEHAAGKSELLTKLVAGSSSDNNRIIGKTGVIKEELDDVDDRCFVCFVYLDRLLWLPYSILFSNFTRDRQAVNIYSLFNKSDLL